MKLSEPVMSSRFPSSKVPNKEVLSKIFVSTWPLNFCQNEKFVELDPYLIKDEILFYFYFHRILAVQLSFFVGLGRFSQNSPATKLLVHGGSYNMVHIQ